MNNLDNLNHPTALENFIPDKAERDEYVVPEAESEKINKVMTRFRETATNRNQRFPYFNERNLSEYIDDSVGRFIASTDERDGIEDWQARIHVPLTHGKVSTVLGRIVSMLPIAEIVPSRGASPSKAQILSDLYTWSEEKDDYDELMTCATLEAIVKGTVIIHEGRKTSSRKKRTVTGFNSNYEPIIKNEDIDETKLTASIIPLENFYPASPSIRRIEDQPYCFVRERIQYSVFIDKYSCYPKSLDVQPKMTAPDNITSANVQFYSMISIDVRDGDVEVLHYYNRDADEYMILANGVWLNPMQDGSVEPMIDSHKQLPFIAVRFDTIGSDFFYGRSLVDRISALQDVLNVLTNMALDQSFLTIFPPMLTNGIDPIEDDYLRPGRRIPVDTQGLPLNQAFMKLDLGTPSGWHQWMLEYVKSTIESASMDQVSSGQAGVGGRTTAEEIRAAAAGTAAILGVFGRLLNVGIRRKAILRTQNILQYWTDAKYPIVSKILGDNSGLFSKAFNVVTLQGRRLSDGRIGTKTLAMYNSTGEMPSQGALKTNSLVDEMQSGIPHEIIAVDAATIRDIEFDVKFVPNSKSADTRDIQKAILLEKIRVYKTFFPQSVNDQELQLQLAEVFGDDPQKMFNKQQPTTPPPQAEAQGQQVQTQPQADMANNMVQGAMGGNMSAMNTQNLG